jgi:hypothetical protein
MFNLSKLGGLFITRYNIKKFYILPTYHNYVFLRISEQRSIIVLHSMRLLFAYAGMERVY